jgi:ApbE superfamily uncharacterized protein (UPF0280 family)
VLQKIKENVMTALKTTLFTGTTSPPIRNQPSHPGHVRLMTTAPEQSGLADMAKVIGLTAAAACKS